MAEIMQLSASLEDYLEAIFHTVEAKGAARAKDIVMRLGVHNSSVTQALKSLAEKELVNYAPYDTITLTEAGEVIARDVVKRHETLRAFLGQVLGLPYTEADEGACRMEHAVSGPILDRIVKFVEYFKNCPANDIQWDPSAGYFCGHKHDHTGTCGRDSCGHDLELHLPDLKKPASREEA